MADIGELKIGHLVEWIDWCDDVGRRPFYYPPYFGYAFRFDVRIKQGRLVSFDGVQGMVAMSGWFGDYIVTVPVGKLCHDQEWLRGWLVSRLNGSVSSVEGK